MAVSTPVLYNKRWRMVCHYGPCISAAMLWATMPAHADTAKLIHESEMSFVSLHLREYILKDAVNIYGKGDDTCLVLSDFLAGVEFPITVDRQNQSAKGWFLNESRIFLLDYAHQMVMVGGVNKPLEPNSVIATEDGPCVKLKTLASWFPVSFTYQPKDGVVTLESRERLPLEQRLERENLRAQIARNVAPHDDEKLIKAQRIPYRWINIPTIDLSASAAFNHENGKTRFTPVYNVAAVGELAKMTAEGLLFSSSNGKPDALRLRLFRFDSVGKVFSKIPGITEFTLGDVSSGTNTLATSGGRGRGVSVSTYPANVPQEYDRTTLRGDMPKGWDAELYRNGALLAFVEPNDTGRYEFKDVPILFGENAFRIVLYGPQGQRKEITSAVNTGNIIAPRGKIYARASVLQSDLNLIDISRKPTSSIADRGSVRVDADVRTGVLKNLSLGTSVDSYVSGGERLWFGGLSTQTSVGLTGLELEAVKKSTGGLAVQGLVSRRFNNVGVRLRYARFLDNFTSDRVDANTLSRFDGSVDSSLKFKDGLVIPASLRVRYETFRQGSARLEINQQSSLSMFSARLSNDLMVVNQNSATSVSGQLLLNSHIGNYNVRAQSAYTVSPSPRFQDIQASFDKSPDDLNRRWFYSGSLGWGFVNKVASASLGANRRFDKFNIGLNALADTRGSVGFGLNISTSFGREPIYNRWRETSNALGNSGSVVARVFEDSDGSGRFGPDSRIIQGARFNVDAGNPTRNVAKGGVTVIDGLAPYTAVNFRVDPESLDNPDLMQPDDINTAIIPRPGTMGIIDIPLRINGSIEGQVDIGVGANKHAQGGMNIEIVDSAGKVIKKGRSEYDGYFLIPGVPVGKYSVRLSADQLKILDVGSVPAKPVEVTRKNPYPGSVYFRLGAGGVDAQASAHITPVRFEIDDVQATAAHTAVRRVYFAKRKRSHHHHHHSAQHPPHYPTLGPPSGHIFDDDMVFAATPDERIPVAPVSNDDVLPVDVARTVLQQDAFPTAFSDAEQQLAMLVSGIKMRGLRRQVD